MKALLSATGLAKSYGDTRVLHGVDLTIEQGEIVTIVGPNGSGKTTLIRLLIGADAPDDGSVTHRGALVIGYVPQKLSVDRTLPISVKRFLRLPTRRSEDDIARAISRVDLPDLLDRPLSGLSGGQFQRVLLARALLQRPDILVLDEPTQGLDQQGASAFYRLIEALRNSEGCGVLMVSHDLHVVMSASDRVICLNGHICCQGAPEIVSAAPEYRALFGFGTQGSLALYRHEHDHAHDHSH